jgi:hypothetical protein
MGTGPFVTFARSGSATSRSPAPASLLDPDKACHIHTRWSCHACITHLVSGDIRCSPTGPARR